MMWCKLQIMNRLLQAEGLKCLYQSKNGCFTAANSSPTIDIIKKQFSEFDGGEITLNKDEATGIAHICINNPDKGNAVSGKMMVNLFEIVNELKNWNNGKGVILRSLSENMFCSGADLALVKSNLSTSMGTRMSKLMQETTNSLLQLPLISVAVIEGHAIGGGSELATACDYRLMGPSGSIQFVHGKMGVTPGWGGGTRLVHIVGRRQALKLLTRCNKVKADEGAKIGLIDEHINGGVEQAEAWLLKMVQGMSPKVLHALKNIVNTACNEPMEKSLQIERELFGDVWGGKDQLKALEKNMKHK